MADLVLVERREGVALVTLNRPDARNALSSQLLAELEAVLGALGDEADVRAVVLTGADPAFCAGLDLNELEAGGDNLGQGGGAVAALIGLDKPVIGAINGPAVTGGLELALACDFRIGSEHARFADTHARVGIVPGWGLTVRLPRAVGLEFAKEMSLTGNYVNAETAVRAGLMNHLVPHDRLVDTAVSLADDVASCEPEALGRIHRLYDEIAGLTENAALAAEQRAHEQWAAAFDYASLAARRDAVTVRGRAQQT